LPIGSKPLNAAALHGAELDGSSDDAEEDEELEEHAELERVGHGFFVGKHNLATGDG